MTNQQETTYFEVNAELFKGSEKFITIDENGDNTENTTREAFSCIEDAQIALDEVEEKKFSNFKRLFITKKTYKQVFNEDGDLEETFISLEEI